MGFFNKKQSKRELFKQKFSEELDETYEKEFKKKLKADAKKKAQHDALTPQEKFRQNLKRIGDLQKKLKKRKVRPAFDP